MIDGKYLPVQVLGQGGFGQVYLVQDVRYNRPAALKYLHGKTPDALTRFVREANVMWRNLNNEHVTKLYDHNFKHAPPYIVMEYCEYGSLRNWVGMNRPWQDVAAAVAHAIQGLSTIHASGGFHRDIKPDNLLSAKHPSQPNKTIIKVSDFGLAREPVLNDLPMTREAGGTTGYMAPELLLNAPFTPAADIYSLGVVATELLTGQRGGEMLGQVKMPDQMRKMIRGMLSPMPQMRPTSPQVAAVLNGLLSNPNVVAAEEVIVPNNGDDSGGALLVGSLLFAGFLIALGALADGNGKPGAVGGVK